MQENLESLGAYLKKSREEKNVSIEQVAYATRISLKMLRALEEDDHTVLPAPTFVRGYLQAYAKYVRIDTQDLLLRYQHHLATAPDTKKGAIKSHYLYVRERYQEKRQLVLVIVLFATMLSVAGTYFLLKAKRERNKALAKQAEQIQKTDEANPTPSPLLLASTTGTATGTATVSSIATASATATATAKETVATKPAPPAPAPAPTPPPPPPAAVVTPPPAPVTPPPPVNPPLNPPVKKPEPALAEPAAPQAVERPKDEARTYNVLLKASEDVWLRFQADDEPVRDLTLRQGKAMMLRADRVVKIFSGNLGAIKATMNGAAVENLASEPKSKSAVLPASETSKYPLPLFPQFQTKTSAPKAPSEAKPTSGAPQDSAAQ